jgi:hypothetical protein
MKKAPIFLGGACGHTTWRTDITIPILTEQRIPYFNPQLPDGAWTPEQQEVEMLAKNAADIWLFVITADTRSIASIAEAAYRIGERRAIVLSIEDIPKGSKIDNVALSPSEVEDLNRGRAYLREMAEKHNIPVFKEIAAATQHAAGLAKMVADQST